MKRLFLDPRRPFLSALAEHLLGETPSERVSDLSAWTVVLPGARAGRRLLELLARASQARGRTLSPPRIATASALRSLVAPTERAPASELERSLAWLAALRELPGEEAAALLGAPPEPEDTLGWLRAAERLARLDRELAGEELEPRDVARRTAERDAAAGARWESIDRLGAASRRKLEAAGRDDPHRAAIVAAPASSGANRPLLVGGVVDPTARFRRSLRAWPGPVTVAIAAPGARADEFDELGGLRLEVWKERQVDVPLDRVRVVGDPREEAVAVAEEIASFAGRYRADEISVGLLDAAGADTVASVLERAGVPSRPAAGAPARTSLPARLLAQVASWLSEGSSRSFAELVRHRDVDAWLRRRPGLVPRAAAAARDAPEPDWLTPLDRWLAEHLPRRLSPLETEGPRAAGAAASPEGPLRRAREALSELVAPLDPTGRHLRTLGEWADPILDLLAEVYGDRPLDPRREAEHRVIGILQTTRDLLEETSRLPPALAPSVPGATALEILRHRLDAAFVPYPADAPAAELLGWLELPLDDAPALVLTGLTDDRVPGPLAVDPLLPEPLRRELGLVDSERRRARDTFHLETILAPREEARITVPRRDRDEAPLIPSRLLFGGAVEELSVRARALFSLGSPPPPTSLAPGVPATAREEIDLPVPEPAGEGEIPDALAVTSFRDYLACPYRFWLRHVLRLRSLEDRVEELDPARFGSLAHDVLQSFGAGEARDETDARAIARDLDRRLDREASARFGPKPHPAVPIQVELLRARLHAFARWQARRRAEGWRIIATEAQCGPREGAALEVDGRPMGLVGRIDRVDRSEENGAVALLDYKTSDTPKSPEKIHRRGRGKSKAWVDLQLPLYRHLAARLGYGERPRLGFVQLPRDLAAVGLSPAEWTGEELEEAEEVARDVVRSVREERFWPPAQRPPPFSTDWSPICQDGRWVAEAREETAP